MSAHSAALAPARTGRFGRNARLSTGLVIASIAVAGAIVAVAAAVGLSQSQATPLAAHGGTGHVAPMTSSFERSVESGSMSNSAGAPAVAFEPSSLVVRSATTGRDVRIPSAESPLEQALVSQASTATGSTRRVPPADSPLERAAQARLNATGAATVVVINAAGFGHRLPLR